MWDGLDKLIELQKLDVAIAKLDAEARAIPKTIEALEGRLDKAREAFEVAKATFRSAPKRSAGEGA